MRSVRPTPSSTTPWSIPASRVSREDAEIHFAGKRGGRPSPQQRDINELIIAEAKRDAACSVSRAAIRSCSGAEAKKCARGAGIPCSRVVPHYRRPAAATALRGIPATTRETNHAVILAAGHRADDAAARALVRGAHGRPASRSFSIWRLRSFPRSRPHTPASAVSTQHAGRRLRTPRAPMSASSRRVSPDFPADVAAHGITSPAVIVLGANAALRSVLAPGMSETMTRTPPPGLIIAAPASGSGKTTITLGLSARAHAQGHVVAAVQVRAGLYRSRVSRRRHRARLAQSRHVKAMRRSGLRTSYMARVKASVVIAEGVMGLFDSGVDAKGQTARGSTGGSGCADRLAGRARARRIGPGRNGGGARRSAAPLPRGHRHCAASSSIASAATRTRAHDRAGARRRRYPVSRSTSARGGLHIAGRHLDLVQAGETAGRRSAHRSTSRTPSQNVSISMRS